MNLHRVARLGGSSRTGAFDHVGQARIRALHFVAEFIISNVLIDGLGVDAFLGGTQLTLFFLEFLRCLNVQHLYGE